MNQPLWTPSRERIANANMTRFISHVNSNARVGASSYPELYAWSVEQPARFWSELVEFCGVRFSADPSCVLERPELMPGARWFPGAELNFAEHLLRYRDEQPAVIYRDESGRRVELSYAELFEQTARLAAALRTLGVVQGDRVAAFMPNSPQTVVAMLATTSLGAIFSSCSPDFGLQGVVDRFSQIKPKVLFTADGYFYGGRRFDSLERSAGIAKQLAELEQIVVVPNLDDKPDIAALDRASLLADLLPDTAELTFDQLPFDHPLYIMYSSGTTGVPKCIVHGAGGTLIQHLKELTLHTDLRRDDRIFYFTTCGWMMWNWLISSLATGATIVLYDGSPVHPSANVLWRVAEEEGLTVFGTSARYLAGIEKEGVSPGRSFDLSRLRTILSTGSPLAPESFDFVYREIAEDIQLSSISGGTDIISCFALGNPVLPVYSGELQCRGLGMRVEIFDDQGRSVRSEKGELVCTAPFPSMPVGFWNDPDGRKYHGAYFERFDNTWCHGDYAELTEHDGLIIHGRSDAVLNPGGVRIGTAEIYRQAEKIEEVLESIAVGQEWQGDVRVVLFVRLREGTRLTEALSDRIRSSIRAGASPRHVPAKMIAVTDIPRTISGKIVELAVRNVIHGRAVENLDALANPEALDQYRDLPELET